MSILALDFGTNLGWAIYFGPGAIVHGTIRFPINAKIEGGGMRWLRYRKWLLEMIAEHGPLDAVYFESVNRHLGTDAAHIYGGFLGHTTQILEAAQPPIPYSGVGVATIKKHATGKGNAGKDDMIAAMKAKGFTPFTDNDADALALLHYVLDERRRIEEAA